MFAVSCFFLCANCSKINYLDDDDHEYQVIPDSYLGASSTYSSNGSGNRYSGGFAGRQPQWNSNANGWNRRSYGDRPQRMTSFAPDLEDPTSKPIRAGTFPHKKQNNINTEELFSLIPSSGIHHSTSTKPRSSGFKPGQLPPKKSGHDFSQHPFTSNSSSSSQNSGLSDLHPSGNSIPQVPIAEEETQLLQNPERGRKASYNVPNNIPLEPPHLSSFSNTPQAGVFTNGNGKFYFHLLLAAVVSIMFYLPVLVSAAVFESSLNRLSGLSNTPLWFY